MDEDAKKKALHAQLLNVYDVLEDGVAVFEPQGGLVLVNEAEARTLGYASPEDMMGASANFPEVWELRQLDGSLLPVEAWPVSRVLAGERVSPVELLTRRRDTGQTWRVSFSGQPLRDASGELTFAVIISRDVTEQRRREAVLRLVAERDRLRARLSDALRFLADPRDVQNAASQVLGEFLGASRVHYAEASADAQYVQVHSDYHIGVPSAAGRYRLDDYGPVVMDDVRAGRRLAIHDVAGDPRLSDAEKAATAQLQVAAYAVVPLLKSERLAAVFAVHHARPHFWSSEELALIEEVAERTWAAVERARSDQALRNSERRYRALFDSIDQGFCVLEMLFDGNGKATDYRFLETNPAFERHTGLVNAVGKRAMELVPNLEPHWPAVYGQVALTGEPQSFVQGSEAMGRWFEVAASRVGEPEERKVALLFTDVSERRRGEAALRESEQRFRMLADNMSQLAWIADESGAIFWFNRRWYEYAGDAPEEMQGRGWEHVHHPEHRDRVVSRMQRSWTTGEPWEDLFPLRGRNGQYRWFLGRALPIRDEQGTITRWFGTHTDVTEQRQAEERLRESDRRKDEYLAMLGHELRNPLAAIHTATELVRLANAGDPRIARASQVLARQTSHMVRLIDSLLEVSRIARGKVKLEPSRLDLRTVCEGVLDDHQGQIVASGLELTKRFPAHPLWVWADGVRIAQVFDNLVGNALKFTPAPGRIEVVLGAEKGCAVLQVCDSGVGIRPERLSLVFEAFHQEAQDVARGRGGLGLGLALVKGLVEMHGGQVEVTSEGLGQGSAFTVRLPMSTAPPGSMTR